MDDYKIINFLHLSIKWIRTMSEPSSKNRLQCASGARKLEQRRAKRLSRSEHNQRRRPLQDMPLKCTRNSCHQCCKRKSQRGQPSMWHCSRDASGSSISTDKVSTTILTTLYPRKPRCANKWPICRHRCKHNNKPCSRCRWGACRPCDIRCPSAALDYFK